MTDYSPAFTSLVAALRDTFSADGLASLDRSLNNSPSQSWATATLRNAVQNAADPSYDPGDNAHPAAREHFERTGKAIR